jgi:hypothetical protein
MTEENKTPIADVQGLIDKVESMKRQDKMDLSSAEDLSIALMNLISLEEHFFFTGAKLNKPEYFDMLNEIREMRKKLLPNLVQNPEGEEWCVSKHLLAASMRLMEVGTKSLSRGKKEEAQGMFQKAYDLYSLFWGINLKVMDVGEVKKIDDGALNRHDTEKKGVFGKLGEMVKKVIDCCIE